MLSPYTRPASTDLDFFSPSKSSKPIASTSSSVTVTTRTVTRRPNHQDRTPSRPPHPLSSSPLSSPLSSPARKRKSSHSDPPSASAVPRQVKRLRTSPAVALSQRKHASASSSRTSSRASSKQPVPAPSPEPIYRSSRSRSTSLFLTPELDPLTLSRRWSIDQDGFPGKSFLSSEMAVRRFIRTYKAYFKNPQDKNDYSFNPHPTMYPVFQLEYPNTGASERFILLAPKDKDHYNPIMDLEKTLYTIIEHYLTPDQQLAFGAIPKEYLSDTFSPPSSPSPSPPQSQHSDSSSTSHSSWTSLSTSSPPKPPPLLRTVQRAIHRQDGPLFLDAMNKINNILRSFKTPSTAPHMPLKQAVESWTNQPLPKKVVMRIIDENYQRCVGPHVSSLKQYEAFSSTVYGELMPSLAYEIIQLTGLKEDSLFLDLGSGVGNVVVQASLQTGCKSFGIELMPAPAKVARDMVEQFKIRCAMWGIAIGEIELEEGDMLQSRRVDELIAKADVVLVDNKVFEESLNAALRPKFLDLKEGAIVVSLSPFVPVNARVTERNVDDISAIFDVTERTYHSGSVSWGNGGGTYYIHRVDREGYAKIRERFESSRTGSSRSTRSRR